MVIHHQFFADPLGQKIRHRMRRTDHIFGNWLLEQTPSLFNLPVYRFCTRIDKTLQIGDFLAHRFEQMQRTQPIDLQIFDMAMRTCKSRGQMIYRIHTLNRTRHGLVIAQIAFYDLDCIAAFPFARPAGIAGIDKAAYVVALVEQAFDQIAPHPSV